MMKNNDQGYPTHWKQFCRLRRSGLSEEQIGFEFSDGDANRFASRYRFAKGFNKIDFNPQFSMKRENVEAYSAMLRTTLAFAAWETIQPNHKYISFSLDQKILCKIRRRNKSDLFIEFLAQRTIHSVKNNLQSFCQNTDVDPMYLAAGIRHIFAHGILTANANGTTPSAVRDVSNWLANYVLINADTKFSNVVNQASCS